MTERKRREVRNPSHVRRGEQPEDAMWRHVIMQAIEDATTPLPNHPGAWRNQLELIRGQARRWIKQQTEDFRRVCDLAGLAHDRVHAFAMSRIREAMAKEQERVAEFLKGSNPGVVQDPPESLGDRRPMAPQKTENIGFSQNGDSAP
jgi:hypothetical protein